MKILQIFLLSIIFCSCKDNVKSQENAIGKDFKIENKKVLALRDSIAEFNEVQDIHIGYAGSPSIQYGYFQKLMEIVTDKELIKLTKDTNYSVATYAAFGLITRKNNEFISVFKHFLYNDQTVKTMKGCKVGTNLVSSEIYYEYWNKVRFESNDEKFALQNDENLLKLDSLILMHEDSEWLLYDRVFSNRIFSKNYQPIILDYAFNKRNIYAIEYLYNNDLHAYQDKIIECLTIYLKQEEIWPIYYDKIYKMLLSFNQDSLNQLLLTELIDIEKQYGKDIANKYRKMLLSRNIK
jgi:hypothetical protein